MAHDRADQTYGEAGTAWVLGRSRAHHQTVSDAEDYRRFGSEDFVALIDRGTPKAKRS
jgi:hypothetical protein